MSGIPRGLNFKRNSRIWVLCFSHCHLIRQLDSWSSWINLSFHLPKKQKNGQILQAILRFWPDFFSCPEIVFNHGVFGKSLYYNFSCIVVDDTHNNDFTCVSDDNFEIIDFWQPEYRVLIVNYAFCKLINAFSFSGQVFQKTLFI